MNLTDLPKEVLGHILIFLNVNYNKKIIYTESRNINGSYSLRIKKVNYIPSKLCLINKSWYNAFLVTRCNFCNTGKYDITKEKCINCNHILNGKNKRKALKN